LKSASTMATAILLTLASCNKADDASFSSLNSETAIDSKVDEVNDIATSALNSYDAISGRVEDRDDRLECATISKEAGNTKDAGKITLTFKGDCKDDDGDVRTGKIAITWSGGVWFVPSSTHTITLENYTVNGVLMEGTRVVKNIITTESSLTSTIQGSHKSTWPDGTSAARTVNRTRQWARSSTSPLQNRWIISQTDPSIPAATGTNRNGKNYSVQITKPLQYVANCGRRIHIPVIGVKTVTVDTELFTVDYGDGTCDNLITVTKNGVSKTVKVDKDGN
ncbi:MAG: hypothetical protein ORN54_06640, partial [Cyclobacteriaceae bacterium]|nr:hypothetical protein [Cyclobacteriaceae bacterium]